MSANRRTVIPATIPVRRERTGPAWEGESWGRDDGVVLNVPVFENCGLEFKRMLLRAIRCWEYEYKGRETWFDETLGHICTLETLQEGVLPPLQHDLVGVPYDPDDYLCSGGDYDHKLVVVLSGKVQKFSGHMQNVTSPGCLVRELRRGDCEGIAEFLGVGTDQRTCTLRAGPAGCKVRYVDRASLVKLLAETDSFDVPRWPVEKAIFSQLSLDRIDSLNHKDSLKLLMWPPGDHEIDVFSEPKPGVMDVFALPGQTLFTVPNDLGTTRSGPLPEGLEERYFFDGQTVLKAGVVADCALIVLRGSMEAQVPDGCEAQCLRRNHLPFPGTEGETWLSNGRGGHAASLQRRADMRRRSSVDSKSDSLEMTMVNIPPTRRNARLQELAMVALVAPHHIKKAQSRLRAAASTGDLDLDDQINTDWRWALEDPRSLTVVNCLDEAKLLSPNGEQRAEEVRARHDPPPPVEPEPQAFLGPGAMIGQLALLGVPLVLSGDITARGPLVVAILHRHVLLEALQGLPELDFFVPRGVSAKECVEVLAQPMAKATEVVQHDRPEHLGPVTGPPTHKKNVSAFQDARLRAGSPAAYNSPDGPYSGKAGMDAIRYLLLNSMRNCNFIWDLIHDASDRLLEALVKEFEPRWLLPNEVVIVDEEPNADFMFIVVYGTFVVTLEGAEIDRITQGAVQGESQLLNLVDWTRTITADASNACESMVQVLRRESLVKVLAGHPGPKGHMRSMEENLRDAREADWSILRNIPAFGSACSKPFLSRILKDADIRLYCPGDFLAEVGEKSASMLVVLAGACRCEQPQTLFYVELTRGDWCFQNNILGVEATRAHDVVAVTHVIVLVLYRHALLNAVIAFPSARENILENESWRTTENCPQLGELRIFEGVPQSILARLEHEGAPLFFRAGSCILERGGRVEDDNLLFILRGRAHVTIFGIGTRMRVAGDIIGVHNFLGLEGGDSQASIIAVESCDILSIQRSVMVEAMKDERFEEALSKYKSAMNVLAGGAILDAFGFPVGGVKARAVHDCIEKSQVFSACSEIFVKQIPKMVEERAYWPGDHLYAQGEDGECMYFIRAGRCRLQVLGRKEDELTDAGHTLGDLACLDQVPHHMETAIAETHVWARVLHKKLLRRALKSFPEEERRLIGRAQRGSDGIFEE